MIQRLNGLRVANNRDGFHAWLLVLLISGVVSAATPANLIDAVKSGDAQTIRAMLKQRANVNATEADGMSI